MIALFDGLFGEPADNEEFEFDESEVAQMDDSTLLMAAIYELHANAPCTSQAISEALINRIIARSAKNDPLTPPSPSS